MPMTQTINRVAITGNTYPVRTELRNLGGEWDKGEKAWMVPSDKAEEAKALVGGRGRHGERAAARSQSYKPSNYRPTSKYRTFGRCSCEDYPCCGH